MLDLWLIRHAESQGNVDGTQADTPLSPRGARQADALRAALAPMDFERVFTSPLLRARETAARAIPGAEPVVEPALTELRRPPDRFIDTSSLTLDDLRKLADATEASPAETGPQFRDRIRGWLRSLEGVRSAIAFTHYAVIREGLYMLTPEQGFVQSVEHCAIFRIEVDEGRGRLRQTMDSSESS
ncbi:histidine phosphatase family protein [Paraliomyxa miuraensis]|uniref:histidine phosphatase family protein n=1 Tax=Paraliomyxa miuraensis TaxID=376150 RepID=UPI00224CAF4C|nr:histidine phosphatase family protein [Paraliomyxa miuraensis]MCX4241828.1 histidine phosphatase family protein [Paraliomyxa miuraensis]